MESDKVQLFEDQPIRTAWVEEERRGKSTGDKLSPTENDSPFKSEECYRPFLSQR